MNDMNDNNLTNKNKNIVNFQHKPEANLGQILPKIHKIFITGRNPGIKKYYDKLYDTLFDLAEKAENNEKPSQYFDAMRAVLNKKDLILRKFSDNLQHVFKQFKKGDYPYFKD